MIKIQQDKHQLKQEDFIYLQFSLYVIKMEPKIELINWKLKNTKNKQSRILWQLKHKKIKELLNIKMTKKLQFV